jgi:hypothetical protein
MSFFSKLFGGQEKKKSIPSISRSGYSKEDWKDGFPKAQNPLGITGEEELRKRAKIILNDTNGIIKNDEYARTKMKAYLNDEMPHDLMFFDFSEAPEGLTFWGYEQETNRICFCWNLDEINFRNITIGTKLAFFPTESTPHFIGKIGVNDGTKNSQGFIDPVFADVNLTMSSLMLRVILYELIAFPDVTIIFIDRKSRDKSSAKAYEFKNSFNLRVTFLREAEAYMRSLANYSIFSEDLTSSANEYHQCFENSGAPISPDAIKYLGLRAKYLPTPEDTADWMWCMV